MKIPSFQGKSDPKAYLEWVDKVERVFDCHNYSEAKKLKLVVLEFTNYAAVWWDQLRNKRRLDGEPNVETWAELKRIMRRRFVPSHYYRELHNRLQLLVQGSMSVEEYYQAMEVAMIRANVVEDREATMARFMRGLNREIANVVELHDYVELEDLYHKALKVEKQQKGKSKGLPNSRPWNSAWRSGNQPQNKTPETSKVVKPNLGDRPIAKPTPEHETRPNKIKCFKCLGFGHIAS